MSASSNFCHPSFLLWLIFMPPFYVQLKTTKPSVLSQNIQGERCQLAHYKLNGKDKLFKKLLFYAHVFYAYTNVCAKPFYLHKNQCTQISNLSRPVYYEIINFQRDLFFKEHFWRRRLSILFSILSIIVSVIRYPISKTKSEKVFDNILGKMLFE